MIQQLSDWLVSTWLSHQLQVNAVLIPLIQSVHILAIGALLAAMSMLALRMLGIGWAQQPLAQLGLRLLPWMWRAVVVLAITGLLMIIAEPQRSLSNPAFQIKMLMLLTILAISYTLGQRFRLDASSNIERVSVTRWTGLFILLIWTGIVVAGRWIAYL